MQLMTRQRRTRLAWLAGAAVAISLGGCDAGDTALPEHEHIGSLSAAQCAHFSVNGKVQICHRTHSPKHPYRILEISEQACVHGHAAHEEDYVAVNDPTCQGGGCLPPGAPCDATLPCCDGASCQSGVCTASCKPGAFRYETRPYTAGVPPQTSAEAIAAFHAAPEGAYGYGSTTVEALTNLSNQYLFQGTYSEIGYHVVAKFNVAPADAGTWQLRAGMDFGLGGALLVDGDVVDFRSTDMWWGGTFSDPAQYLHATVALDAGVHTVELYGFENCCDGPSQVEYWSPTSGTWFMFSTAILEVCCPGG